MVIAIRRLSVMIVATGAVIVVALFPRFAVGEPPPGVHSLNGTYRGSSLEIRHDPGSEIEFCEIVGTVEADGRGNLTLDAIRRCSITGTFHDVSAGTYTVDRDGLALFAFAGGDGGKGIVADGGSIVIIDNDDPADPHSSVLVHHGVFAKIR